ncbi:NAD(P)-dependent oxidoreductase [Clostridium moutaii]
MRIKLMKNISYLINALHWEIVVEEDLYRALKEKIILGDAFDVFSVKFLKSDSLFKTA